MSLKPMKKPRTMVRFAAVAVAGGIVAALLPGTPAFALGNNRDVNRSCGVNHVASGLNSQSVQYWAETSKVSGNCLGRLSTALRDIQGRTTGRSYGDKLSSSTYLFQQGSGYDQINRGVHWGCDACNETIS